uniref:Uncharacterized protein n=1 Tax=Meloidogyne hapla TaxID=6305 RepID=A0A1I8C2R5_MELHA
MIRLKFNSILFLFLLLFIYFSQNVEGGKDKVPEQTEEAAKEIKTNRNVWGKKQTILGKNEVKGEEKDEKEYENNFPLFNGKKLHKKEIREYSYLNQNKNKEKYPEFLKREEESKNQDKNQGKEENVEILNFQKDSVQSSPKSSGEDTVAAQEKEKIEKANNLVESSTSNQSDRDLPPEEKCSESSQCLKTEEDENEEKEEDELNIKNLFSPNNSVHSSPKSSEEQSVVIDPTEESNENLSDGDLENKFCNETIEFLKNEKEKEEKGKGKLKMGESVKSFIQNGQIQGNLKQTRGFSRNLRRKKVRFYRNQANSDGESSSTFQQQLTQKSPNAFVGYNNFRRNLNQPKPLFKPYQTNYQQNSSVLGKPQAHLNNLQ